MKPQISTRNAQEIDPRLFARLSAGLILAAALAWTAIYASFPNAASVDETAFEAGAAASR